MHQMDKGLIKDHTNLTRMQGYQNSLISGEPASPVYSTYLERGPVNFPRRPLGTDYGVPQGILTAHWG